MAHPNEELLRRGYEAFGKGDMDTIRELFDPNIVWHAPGRNPMSGDYRGVDEVLTQFGNAIVLTAFGWFLPKPNEHHRGDRGKNEDGEF